MILTVGEMNQLGFQMSRLWTSPFQSYSILMLLDRKYLVMSSTDIDRAAANSLSIDLALAFTGGGYFDVNSVEFALVFPSL
jgi:hypothetical protein